MTTIPITRGEQAGEDTSALRSGAGTLPGQSPRKTLHRPDIDGLRAVAILSVLGFHAWPDAFPGGFVGVDVFFVISGYLISSIIFKGLISDSFSFIDFYSRRVRRIFPALAVVLCAVWLAGWFYLLMDEFSSAGKHVAAGAGFVSNVVLWKEAGYFDPDASLKPLLHLWSLGIEEQFYFAWPLLAFLAWRSRINLLATLAIVGGTSFLLNVDRVVEHEVSTFYLPATRLWELAIGCILAYWQLMRPPPSPSASTIFDDFVSFIGASLLALSIFTLNSQLHYPGWWALLPTLGSACIIAAGQDGRINRRLLAARPMVFVGLISYPLYLWHWPLLAFQRVVNSVDPGNLAKAATLMLAAVLAWLTYRFVETPIRTNKWGARTPVYLVTAIFGIGVLGYASFSGVIQARSARYGLSKIVLASTRIGFPGPHLHPINEKYHQILGQGYNVKRTLFIGDSEIEQYYPRIDKLLTNDPVHTRSVAYATSGGCPPIPHLEEAHHRTCAGMVGEAIRYASTREVETVVVGANWAWYFGNDIRNHYYFNDGANQHFLNSDQSAGMAAWESLRKMVDRMVQDRKHVVLILQTPFGPELDPRQMIRRDLWTTDFSIQSSAVDHRVLIERVGSVNAKLREVARLTGAEVVDPSDTLCSAGACPVMTADGEPMYRDNVHLNPLYVRNTLRYVDRFLLPN